MSDPWLRAYRALTIALGPTAPLLLAWRRQRGKEDAARLNERLGIASAPRGDRPVAWLHGASVGEGLALTPLVERLRQRGFHALVTTGTVTSSTVVAERLPAGATHQFVPLDTPKFMARFFDHWRPSIALVAESELWPNMLSEAAARGIPLALVNARLSERSFRRWRSFPHAIAALLQNIELCLAQSQDDAARLMLLGARRVQVAGNLKYDVSAPPVDSARLAVTVAAMGSRPVWVAASTHAGEETIVVQAHVALAQRLPLITIVVPRHPDRGAEIAAQAARLGVAATLRSSGVEPSADTPFYIADTIGELGLFYRLASVVYMGKSLVDGGGQNPIEPAKLGSAILHGPGVANFAEVYRELNGAGGALEVGDADALTQALGALLSDSARLRLMARAASETVERLSGATDNIMKALEPYFVEMKPRGA